jgi:hypothetical protein
VTKLLYQSVLTELDSVRQFKMLNSAVIVANRAQELDATWPTRVEVTLSSRVQGHHAAWIVMARPHSPSAPSLPRPIFFLASPQSRAPPSAPSHASTPLELERSHALLHHRFS